MSASSQPSASALRSFDIGLRFGRAVRSWRESRGWTQEDLAAEAELNRSYLGEVERGDVMPSLVTAAKLASALAVPLSTLISECERGPVPRA